MVKNYQLSFVVFSGLVLSANALALQTPSSLVGELVQDVTILTKTGTCNINPYITDPTTQTPTNPPCAPAVVTCPKGKTPLAKKLVACDVVPNANQATVSQIVNASLPAGFPTRDPNSLNTFEKKASNATAQAQCLSGVKQIYSQTPSYGYTPWCFYKRAGKPLSSVSFWGPDFYVGGNTGKTIIVLADGTKLSAAQINNPLNWFCYPIDYKTTARCITAPPAAGLNRLGIQLK